MEKSATARRQRTPAQPRRSRTNSRADHVGTIPTTTTTNMTTPQPPPPPPTTESLEPAIGLHRSSFGTELGGSRDDDASAAVSQTSLMCFCCCCCYCSRNCLDCTANPGETPALIINSPGVQRPADSSWRTAAGLVALKGPRKRPPALMSKCWHWTMVLLMLVLFFVTICVLRCPSSSSYSAKKGCNGNEEPRGRGAGSTVVLKMHQSMDEESLREEEKGVANGHWNHCGREYLYNYSNSYHHIGQLRKGGGGERVGENERAGRVGEIGGTDGCRMGSERGRRRRMSSSSSRRGNNDSDDSWGDKDPRRTTKQQCNLLRRILDSGINSIQFLKSQFARHLCNTINGHLVTRSGAVPGGGGGEKKYMKSDLNNSVVKLVAGRRVDPKDREGILINDNQSYHINSVTLLSDTDNQHSHETLRHRPRMDKGRRMEEHQDQILNQSVLAKESIPIHLASPLIRHVIMANEDNLEAMDATSDNPDGRGLRHFYFLRKLQYIEEEEEERDEENDVEIVTESNSIVALEAELQAIETDFNTQSDTPLIDPSEAVVQETTEVEDSNLKTSSSRNGNPITSIQALEENLQQEQRVDGDELSLIDSDGVGDNLINSPLKPTQNMTLKSLELFLDRIRPPLFKRAIQSPNTPLEDVNLLDTADSQLLRLEQRLRIGLKKQKNVGGRGKANKCKLNGKSATCRRRNGAQRKVEKQQKAKNKWPPTTTKNVAAANKPFTGGEKSKSSGDKWKFILENFCAKSHLHGQLPKLIAKLELQQQRHGDKATKPRPEKQDHGQTGEFAAQEIPGGANADDDEDDDEDELAVAARTTDSLRLEVIKEQILKKLGLKQKPNITNIWTAAAEQAAAASTTTTTTNTPRRTSSSSSSKAAAATATGSPVDATEDGEEDDDDHDDSGGRTQGSSNSSSSGSAGSQRRMVEKKTANFMFGIGPTGIQLPNNNSQFFIHDGHTRPMDQELFLSKELILATLYRAQLDSIGHHHPPPPHGDRSDTDPSSGPANNRLFDDLHVDGGARRRRRKGRKRKRKSGGRNGEEGAMWPEDDYEEDESHPDGINREDLKSHTRRYLEEEFGEDDEGDFDEEDAFHERNHRYQWQNNQQDDDGQTGDEDSYGQSREIITFAERGKLLNGRQHLLEFKPVGDHQTPGGSDFRIRSAVLWLKVEHLKQAREPTQRDGGTNDSGGGGGQNITIWIFNMKTPGWESKVSGDCTLNYATMNGEKVERNCPTSADAFSNYQSGRNGIEDADPRNSRGNQELNLDEKDFNRVSELTLTHTIHLNPRDDYRNNNNNQKFRGRSSQRDINLEEEDVNFVPTSDHSPLSSNGWHKFDITAVVRRWNNVNRNQRPVNLQLLVDCTGCRRHGVHVHLFHGKLWNQHHQPPLANENRPFLVAHTEPNTMKRVRRRALDCSGAQNGRCCKQRFYVSFKALGWDDWIIAPHGYFANYCRGSCAYRTADMLPTPYSKFINEFRKLGKMAEMQPCCAPLKFSSMSLIYFDQERNIIKRDLPKMVVDECGCP